jgi:hypothetical protein
VDQRQNGAGRREHEGTEGQPSQGAGHTLYDPGMRNAMMKAIADVASKITK